LDFLNKYAPQAIALLRIVTGLQFLEHGTSKILHFPLVAQFAQVTPLEWPDGIAGVLEIVLGVLIIIGLFSRIAAFIASGEMAFAYFMAHAPRGFFPLLNGGDTAVCFCFIFLALACAGPGSWALNRQ
jgi:putative oxidoreductase